jgi:hypothetical protein
MISRNCSPAFKNNGDRRLAEVMTIAVYIQVWCHDEHPVFVSREQ